ncbi:TPA: hypothetical protein I7139_23800 [Vibrio vulnificus]|nr:hypothetical protein [Vibrio vulnificus]
MFTPNLSQAKDLLEKAKYDYKRLVDNPSDSYAAFDFFVTVEHLPDWLNDKSIRRDNDILKLVSHIANGAKHLTLDDKRHNTLTGVQIRTDEWAEEKNVPSEHILFEFQLDPGTFQGLEVSAVYLAELVLNFWVSYFKKRG